LTLVVKVNVGFNFSRATAAVTNFVEEAGIKTFSEFIEPSRKPIQSTAAQLFVGTLDDTLEKLRTIFPVRVMTDNVLGVRRADSSETLGITVTDVSI
jgi:hypothetical protein